MKRLCFYCFWITDYSRLIRRYVAKEYYALSDEQLLSIPFFASSSLSSLQLTPRFIERHISETEKHHFKRPWSRDTGEKEGYGDSRKPRTNAEDAESGVRGITALTLEG